MSTARDQLLDFMRSRGRATTAEISEHVEASQQYIYDMLAALVKDGTLVREQMGRYAMPDSAPEQAEQPEPHKRRKARFTQAPEAAQEPQYAPEQPAEAEDTADTPDPLQWALWHDGDLMIRRGETALVLAFDEVRRLHAWLEAMRTAVHLGRA